MRTGKYTQKQIDIFRKELNAVYKKAEKVFENISWNEIGEWIEKAFENLSVRERKAIAKPYRDIKTIKLSGTDSFRKFCQGKTKEMMPERMIAIDIWLTEKADSWSELTSDQTSRFKNYSEAGASLAKYLFKNNSYSPTLDLGNLAGEYTGAYCVENKEDGGESDFILNICKSLTPRILVVEVEEYRTFKRSVRLEDEEERKDEENNLYSGWVTLSPEDNLICYLKNVESGVNSIYYLIAINESINKGANAECLLFLNRQAPAKLKETQKPEKFLSYLIDWAEANQGNLISFQRSPEDV